MRLKLLLLGLLLIPNASALETLTPHFDGSRFTVTDEQDVNFRHKNTETYSFNLNSATGLDYNAAYGHNDSISSWGVTAGISKDENVAYQYGQNTHWEIEYNYNQTEALRFTFDYVWHGWGKLGYWEAIYQAYHNGERICEYAETLQSAGYHLNTQPEMVVVLSPRTGYTGVSTEIRFYFYDSYGMLAQNECVNPDTGGSTINATSLTGPLSVTITPGPAETFTHHIDGSFSNLTMSNGYRANISAITTMELIGNDFGVDLSCTKQADLAALIACGIRAGIEVLLTLLRDTMALGLSFIFHFMPAGETLKEVLLFPVDFTVEILTVIFSIYLSAGPGYPPGGTWLMLLVYSTCLGLALSGIMGDLKYSWKMPGWFIVGSTYGIFLVFYWVYWKIPVKVFETILKTAAIVRGTAGS